MARSVGPLPSGLVTFVFTDIEGSTRLFRRLSDRYPALLARHHEILREAWAVNGGCEVKTEGDAFFVAFSDPTAAVVACARAQQALTEEAWPLDGVIRVRMGVHEGLAAPRDDDYIAFAVHQAARIVNAGHGGQIVVSAETAERVTAGEGLSLLSLGRYRVRDFDDPVELFQVIGPGLPAEFPPVRVLPADRHNLVPAASPVVGRDDDLVRLAEGLGAARLVSVVGPGGVGKTTLVTEYGVGHAQEWEHGVWFVDLAPLSSPSLLIKTVAEAIGAPLGAARDPQTAVLDHLRHRRALLIMDNCEQLIVDAAVQIDEILRRCPAVAVITTTREPLGLRNERILRLAPLRPDDSAVDLFCDRAGLDRELEPSLRFSVVELCRLLDGLPLAIELAAARCDVLSPTEIRGLLGSQRDLLRSRDPTLRARQRSIDDTIEWSHQLLSDNEQRAFRRLGVFSGGFGLEAAAEAAADGTVGLHDVPELVWSLVSKSVVTSEPAAGSTRYRMLETIRAFARRQLDQAIELPVVAARLSRFYRDAYGPQVDKLDVDFLAERGQEIDNVRALIPIVAPDDPEMAQNLACIVVDIDGRASPSAAVEEGLRLLEQLAAATPIRVALLVEVCRSALDQGLLDTASELLNEAQVLVSEVGSPPWIDGRLEQARGIIAIHRGDLQQAREIALAALREPAGPMGRARVLNLLNMAATELGAFDEARAAAEESLDLVTQLGNTAARASLLSTLAETELRASRPRSAARRQLDGLELALELGSLQYVSDALIVAARLASTANEPRTATRLQATADATMSRIGLSLIPSDRALCDTLLATALDQLGETQFGEQLEAGKALTITDALDEARRVLTTVAHTGPG